MQRFVRRMVDPTLPRYGSDLMTLQFELLHECCSLAFAAVVVKMGFPSVWPASAGRLLLTAGCCLTQFPEIPNVLIRRSIPIGLNKKCHNLVAVF